MIHTTIYAKRPANGPGQTVLYCEDPPFCRLDVMATKDRPGCMLTFSMKHRVMAQRFAKLFSYGEARAEITAPKGSNT